MDGVQIEVPAAPESVGHVRRVLAAFLREQGWGEEEADPLLLATGEACNNAVNYGGAGQEKPRLHVSCRPVKSCCFEVDVHNQGNGFHPDLSLCGQMPTADYATHGRGFGLMLALVDRVQVLSEGENTIVRLTKSKTL